MDQRYDDIAIFLAVARNGSFVSAARALKLPATTVSRRVMELEAALGVQLLRRTTRRLSLTESGQIYADRCAGPFEEINAVTDAIVDENQDEAYHGRLRVTAPMLAGASTIGPWLCQFATAHPRLRLEIIVTDAYLDLVEDGIDLAFRIGPFPQGREIIRHLWSIPYVACATPAVLAETGKLNHPRELESRRLVMTPPIDSWTFRHNGRQFVLQRPSPAASATNLELGAAAARCGLGIAFLPRGIVRHDLEAGTMAEADIAGWKAVDREMYVVYPASRQLSPKVRAAVDYVLAQQAEQE